VAERTRALNRLHVVLGDLLSDRALPRGSLGGCCRKASASRSSQPRSAERTRKWLASELVRDVRALDRKVATLDECIREEVGASGTTLTEVFGVGSILAAKIIGIVGDVGRLPNKEHFASYAGPPPVLRRSSAAGVAPIEACSGEVVRHRVSLVRATAASTRSSCT